MRHVAAPHRELLARPHAPVRPGIDADAPGGPTLRVVDPYGKHPGIRAAAVRRAAPVERAVPGRRAHDEGMTDHDDFLTWVRTTLYEAELALHNGDPAPRRSLWSRHEPVSVLGAWRDAHGLKELDELFTALGRSFSHCTSFVFDMQTYDVAGDMAYTVGLEHTSVSVDGEDRTYTLRTTQVYRREDGRWKVAHRHADTVTG